MSELEKIRKEWSTEGLSTLETEKNLQVLKKVYIGQNIRSEGILKSDFEAQKTQISNLIKKGLITENKWYRHELYLTTERGSKIAREYLEKELKIKAESLSHVVDDLPPNLLRFLLFDYFAKSLSFPCVNEYFLDWRGILFKDSRVIIAKNKILSGLEKLDLCVKTFNYVSTRGGELRDMHFVISPEIQEKLLTLQPALNTGLEDPFKKNCIIFQFLTEKVAPSIKSLENINSNCPLYQEMVNSYRQKYWDALETLNLTEEDVKPIINELAKKGITSEYKGLLSSEWLPFEIKDEIGYRVALKEILIDPVLFHLCKESTKMKLEEKREVERKIPPGLISKEERLAFFDELGDFETKLRNFIASKLGKNLDQCKDKELIEKLKKRKIEDQAIGLPGEPLINYATFDEYATLICSHWDSFKKYFMEENEVRISLKWINALSRRPLAHFRTLTKFMIERSREEIKKILQKIEDKNDVPTEVSENANLHREIRS